VSSLGASSLSPARIDEATDTVEQPQPHIPSPALLPSPPAYAEIG
jgi:hypothetical protein